MSEGGGPESPADSQGTVVLCPAKRGKSSVCVWERTGRRINQLLSARARWWPERLPQRCLAHDNSPPHPSIPQVEKILLFLGRAFYAVLPPGLSSLKCPRGPGLAIRGGAKPSQGPPLGCVAGGLDASEGRLQGCPGVDRWYRAQVRGAGDSHPRSWGGGTLRPSDLQGGVARRSLGALECRKPVVSRGGAGSF